MRRMQSILTIFVRTAFFGFLFGFMAGFANPLLAADEPVPAMPASASVPSWNHAFTLRDENKKETGPAIPLRSPDVVIPASGKWGVSLNFDIKDTTYEKMDRMSAGAYFDLSPRIRLGGSLSFSAPGELRVSTPGDRVLPVAPSDSQSAIRIESSIKF